MRNAPRTLVLVAVLVLAAPAHAAGPTRVTEEIDVAFFSSFWTRACGVPVVQTLQGTLQVELFTAKDGSVREIDTFPGLKFQLSAPSTGGSFSTPLGPTVFEYPEGAQPGAPSIVTTLGLHRRVPGLPAEAGRTVFDGIVLFLDPRGLPIVDFGPPAVTTNGNVNDLFEMIAGACAALVNE